MMLRRLGTQLPKTLRVGLQGTRAPAGARLASSSSHDFHGEHDHEKQRQDFDDPFHNWQWKLLGAAVGGAAIYTFLRPSNRKLHSDGSKSSQGQEGEKEAEAADKPEGEQTQGGEGEGEDEHPPVPKPRTKRPEPLFYDYVIVGSGTAAFSAVSAIRKKEPLAQILIVAKENENPYNRTPLSKELWHSDEESISKLIFRQWDGKHRSIFYEPPEFFLDALSPEGKEEQRQVKEYLLKKKIYDEFKAARESAGAAKPQEPSEAEGHPEASQGEQQEAEMQEPPVPTNHVKIIKNSPALSLSVETRMLTLRNSQKVYYKKLLLVPGGTPKQLSIFQKLPEEGKRFVSTYRKLDDFRKIEKLTEKGHKRIAVVGGGFLGSELACALAHRAKTVPGIEVFQIYPEEGNMALVFPRYLSEWTTNRLREEGIHVINQSQITGVNIRENGLDLQLLGKEGALSVDHVIVAIGIQPNVRLAQNAGLEIDSRRGGIQVNSELEARRDVFAAGDVCSYHDSALQRRRVEHYEHAVVSGRVAGENMTGARKPYLHIPMFWSDLGPKIGYEAVGILDSSLVTVGVWAKASQKDTPLHASDAGASNIRTADVDQIADSSEEKAPEPETKAEEQAPQPAPISDDERYGKGIVYYLKDRKVVGILTWNIFNKMSAARKILKEGKVFEDYNDLTNLIKVDKEEHH